MLGIGLWEWLVLLCLALVVVGPRRLPEVARSLGRWTRDLRRVSRDLRLTLEMELDEEEDRRRRAQIRDRRSELGRGVQSVAAPQLATERTEDEVVTADELPALLAPEREDEVVTADELPVAIAPAEPSSATESG